MDLLDCFIAPRPFPEFVNFFFLIYTIIYLFSSLSCAAQ